MINICCICTHHHVHAAPLPQSRLPVRMQQLPAFIFTATMFELRIMHRGLNGQTFAIVFTTIRGAPKLRNSAHRELSHPTLIPVVHAYICIYSLFTTKKPTAAQLSVGSSAPNRVRDHVLGHVKNM